MNNWVEFDEVKRTVSMQMILDHYKINWLRKSGKELRGRCPIKKGDSDSFNVNLSKNAFNCFSCKARGNVLDLVAAMEQCSVRDAALKIAEWFALGISERKSEKTRKAVAAPQTRDEKKPEADVSTGDEGEKNKVLPFSLRGVDTEHRYLIERGITSGTAHTFGTGFYSGKGSMTGRVVVPIHNSFQELVAYAGRCIDESKPKYRFPGGFHKSLELFNLWRVKAQPWGNDLDGLVVVVEGFFDCMKVWQAGIPVVALMGCTLSDHQERLLAENFVEVLLMLDGDPAGREASPQIAGRLASKLWVKDLVLAEGRQPDQFSTEELNELFDQAL